MYILVIYIKKTQIRVKGKKKLIKKIMGFTKLKWKKRNLGKNKTEFGEKKKPDFIGLALFFKDVAKWLFREMTPPFLVPATLLRSVEFLSNW